MKKETMRKDSLDTRVRVIAESGKCKGMPNWVCLPQNKEKRALHMDVCNKLVELSDANGKYPITALVYFAVGKNAHRIHVFLGGYENIDVKKAETIFKWLKLYAKYNKNEKLFRNSNVAHALTKFYDSVSTSTKDFKAALEKTESNAKIDVKNSKAIVKSLGMGEEVNVDVTEMEVAVAAAAEVAAE